MKIKLLSKKILVALWALSLAIIVAGAFVAGFVGFNAAPDASDAASVEVSGYMGQGGLRENIEAFCADKLAADGYTVREINHYESYSFMDDVLEFVLAGDPAADMREYAAGLQTALDASGIQGLDTAAVTVSGNNAVAAPTYTYVWRTAVAVGVVAVVLFVYVAVRFRLGMGLLSLAALAHDVLLTLALAALLRVPAGMTLAGVAVFAALLSAFLQTGVFGRMRSDIRAAEKEGGKNALPARDAVALSLQTGAKGALAAVVGLAAVCVVLAAVGLFTGIGLTFFALAALVAAAVCGYSALALSPAAFACIKEKSDARRAEKAKYNYASEKKRAKTAKAEPAAEEAAEAEAE